MIRWWKLRPGRRGCAGGCLPWGLCLVFLVALIVQHVHGIAELPHAGAVAPAAGATRSPDVPRIPYPYIPRQVQPGKWTASPVPSRAKP